MIVLGILTDGRDDLLAQCLASAREHLAGQVDHVFVVHDGLVGRKGLAGAVQTVWAHAVGVGADYLFHLEDDFVFTGPVDVAAIVRVLDANRDVAQMLLKRQPLSEPELAGGDVLAGMRELEPHDGWVAQQHIFSLNPCLIPRRVLEQGWPRGNEAEMTGLLRRDGWKFGVWGDPGSPPMVTHLGETRSAGWML